MSGLGSHGPLRAALAARSQRAPGDPCPVCAVEHSRYDLPAEDVCGLCRDDARYTKNPAAYYLPRWRLCQRAGCGQDATHYDHGPMVLAGYCDEHSQPDWPTMEGA